jgi:hypothetical protein
MERLRVRAGNLEVSILSHAADAKTSFRVNDIADSLDAQNRLRIP